MNTSELISLNLDTFKDSVSPVINKKTLMKEYNIGHDTLHKWMYEMDLKFYKMGKGKTSKVLFKRRYVENWFENFTNK